MDSLRPRTAVTLLAGVSIATSCILGAPGVSSKTGQTVTVHEGTSMAATVAPDQTTLIMDLQGALFSLPIKGGTAKRLTEPLLEPSRPHYSPKGGLVAFQSYSGGTFHIWTMKPDGTGFHQLHQMATATTASPAFRPMARRSRFLPIAHSSGQLRHLGRRNRDRKTDPVDIRRCRRVRAKPGRPMDLRSLSRAAWV